MDDSKAQREQRLAEALRANLHRRKQQARECTVGDAPQEPADSGSVPPDAGGSDSKT